MISHLIILVSLSVSVIALYDRKCTDYSTDDTVIEELALYCFGEINEAR